jgi:hypothetical protein
MHNRQKFQLTSLICVFFLVICCTSPLLANDNYQSLRQQRDSIDQDIGFYQQLLDPNLILSYSMWGIDLQPKQRFIDQFVSNMITSGWSYNSAVVVLNTALEANQLIKNEIRQEIVELERQRLDLTRRIMDATPVPSGRRQIPEAAPPSPISMSSPGLSGRWVSSNGDAWTITQTGSNLSVSQSGRGSYSGSFTGQDSIFVKFSDDVQQGCCSATVSGDRKHIEWNNNTFWTKQ